MGACFQEMIVPFRHQRKEIEKIFERVQDQDRYENGHSYSGGFGMATGLTFVMSRVFHDEAAARDWLQDNAQKWENALAVQFYTGSEGDGSIPEERKWLIGAWCSS
jgi:hypothetical protein